MAVCTAAVHLKNAKRHENNLFFTGILLVAITILVNAVESQKNAVGIDMWSGYLKQDDRNYMVGSVLPKPQSQVITNKRFTVNPSNFKFISQEQNSDVLIKAMERYLKLTFPSTKFPLADQTSEDNILGGNSQLDSVTRLFIQVKQPIKPLELTMDESYNLQVSSPYSVLSSKTVWGALRGLETFSQLVFEPKIGSYQVPETTINDFPRYLHRGFLIDTGRHYLPLNIIFKHLDAMSYAKYNLLHWHIVDDQSFPYVSKTFPDLSNTASYTPKDIYTPQQIEEVIEYARLRGIRVMPEFDSPGHTYSWRSIPNLLTECPKPGKTWAEGTGVGPVNPALNSTYEFWKEFLAEVRDVFPDEFIHLGGDEVNSNCWLNNPQVLDFMSRHNMGRNIAKLEEYYFKGIVDITEKLGRKVMMWQEVLDTGVKLPRDSVIHIWKNGWEKEIHKVANAGLPMVISSCWYLNIIKYGTDWEPYYKCEFEVDLSPEQAKLIMGGTTCMWGEWVDATNLLSRSWPRSFAPAERLWSSKEATDVEDMTNRLREHRCRYLKRGIPAEPGLRNMHCREEWTKS